MNEFNSMPTPEKLEPQLLSEPRKVPAKEGIIWIRQAWRIFKRRPMMWVGMMLANILISMLLSVISYPYQGILSNFVSMFFVGGIMLSCDALVERNKLEFSYLFSGFRYKFKDLFKLTALYWGIILLIVIVFIGLFYLVAGSNLEQRLSLEQYTASQNILPIILLCLIFALVLIPISMLAWFSPTLVVLDDLKAWPALKLSFQACKRNIGAFTVFGIIGIGIVASIALLLSIITAALSIIIGSNTSIIIFPVLISILMLLVIPITMITYYTSYRSVLTTPQIDG